MLSEELICGTNHLPVSGIGMEGSILQREIAPSGCAFRPANRLTLGETDVLRCGPFDPFRSPKVHFVLQNV